MSDDGQPKRKRSLDALGLLFVLGLVIIAAGVGAALLLDHIFTPWGLVAWLGGGVAFAVTGIPVARRLMGDGMVHGAARPASEAEAQAAARGKAKVAPVHEQRFPD